MAEQQVEKEFETYIKENELLLHKICRLYAYSESDRKDLFQEIVAQLWKALPKFRRDAKPSTWIYRIAINTAISGLRKQKNFIRSYAPASLPTEIVDDDSGIGEEDKLHKLYFAIEKLSQVEKAIVMLYMEDRSYGEIGDILGITQGNLRVKMNRIKEKLRLLTKNI